MLDRCCDRQQRGKGSLFASAGGTYQFQLAQLHETPAANRTQIHQLIILLCKPLTLYRLNSVFHPLQGLFLILTVFAWKSFHYGVFFSSLERIERSVHMLLLNLAYKYSEEHFPISTQKGSRIQAPTCSSNGQLNRDRPVGHLQGPQISRCDDFEQGRRTSHASRTTKDTGRYSPEARAVTDLRLVSVWLQFGEQWAMKSVGSLPTLPRKHSLWWQPSPRSESSFCSSEGILIKEREIRST